jgi:hypothetical protein
MNARQKLSNRRPAETVAFTYPEKGGQPWLMTVGRRGDGTLVEIFIEFPKDNSCPMANIGHDAAVILSIALQYGLPPKELRAATARNEDGSPHSIIGAALDLICAEVSRPLVKAG